MEYKVKMGPLQMGLLLVATGEMTEVSEADADALIKAGVLFDPNEPEEGEQGELTLVEGTTINDQTQTVVEAVLVPPVVEVEAAPVAEAAPAPWAGAAKKK